MLDRFTSMQVFVRVAALGSFSAAGRALDLSQTMVTKHVAALEGRLGIKAASPLDPQACADRRRPQLSGRERANPGRNRGGGGLRHS